MIFIMRHISGMSHKKVAYSFFSTTFTNYSFCITKRLRDYTIKICITHFNKYNVK